MGVLDLVLWHEKLLDDSETLSYSILALTFIIPMESHFTESGTILIQTNHREIPILGSQKGSISLPLSVA